MSEKFKKLQNLFDFFVMTCTFDSSKDLVAQLVEQQTLNLWVLSSSLSGVTSWDKSKKHRFVPFFLARNLLVF